MTERYEGHLPPDVPAESAEAYRRGYRRAFDGPLGFLDEADPEEWGGPTHPRPQQRRPRWLVPVLVGSVVLALLLGAYGLGRLFSGGADDEPASAPGGDVTAHDGGGGAEADPLEGEPWSGQTRPLDGLVVQSGCVLPPSQDSAGRQVGYEPVNAVDGDFTTAWRCAGDGRGVTLRVSLGRQVRLAEVGLVPGYAKTDPRSGVDRYAENNRITRVRWSFGGGRSVVQRLDPSPGDRTLRTRRIPPVSTDSVTLELLESARGARNTVAISELLLAEAVG